MKKTIFVLCAALAMASGAASAEGRKFSEKQLAQQQVMKDCNAKAKADGLKGADRKAFMKSCLSGDSPAPAVAAAPATPAAPASEAKTGQKEKMKACNADAKSQGLKGDARKTFMSSCLAG